MISRTARNSMLGAVAACTLAVAPSMADVTGDLKAEIASQRAQLEAQRLRLEALEKKLDEAMQPQLPQAAPAVAAKSALPVAPAAPITVASAAPFAPHGVLGEPGEGYTFHITPADSVTLYGLLDVIAVNRNHADAAGNRQTAMEIGWFSGSRWGITGHHEITRDGGAAIFKLESEYEIPTGNMDTPNVLFNRDAWLGYQSDWFGKLTFGRQNALPRDYSAIYGDPYTTSKVILDETGYTNSNNFKQLIFYAASATGTRVDNGIVWKKDFGGFVAGLEYTLGGVPGANSEKSSRAIALGYNGPGDLFHLAGYYTEFQVSQLKHKDYSVGGNVGLGPIFRLYGGYYKDDTEQAPGFGKRKDHAYTVSGKLAPTPKYDFEVGYQVIHADNAGVNGAGNVLVPYADSSAIKGTATGDKTTTYGSFFYHFDRRAEVYVTSDYAKLKDGYKLANFHGFQNQVEFAVGARYRF